MLFAETLRKRAGLLLGQRTAELEQFLKEGLNIHASGVVVLDQLLEPLNQINASRVEAIEGRDFGKQERTKALSRCSGAPLLEGVFEPLAIDCAQIE